jgi:O-antigen ligase
MTKKLLYILIGLIAFSFGIFGAFSSLKLLIVAVAGLFVLLLIFMDYEKVTYFVGLYTVLDFIMRKVISSAFLAGYWDELFLIFCFMLWFYKWFVYRKQKPYKWTPMDFPIMIFFGVSIFLLLANSPDMRIGIDGLRAVIQYIFWYFVVIQLLKSTNAAKHFIYVLVLTGGALALHGVFQYVTGVANPTKWQDKAEMAVRTRVFSIFGTPNVLASLLVLLIPLSIALVLSEKNRIKKLIFICTTLLMSASLVFTFTRGAWLAFIIVIFIFVFLKDKRFILPSVFALIIGSVLIVIFIPSVANRVLYLISPEYLASSAKGGRIFRFVESLYLIKNNLWFGLGLGQFGGSVALNNKIPGAFSVDNYYVKTAVEMGLLGFSAFCIMIYNVIIWSIRTIVNLKDKYFKTLAIGAFSGLCGVLIHNFTENMFEVPTMTVYFWSIVAFIMFIRYSNDMDNSIGNPSGALKQ